MVPAFIVLSSFLYPFHQELWTCMGRPTRADAHSSSMRMKRWGWEAGGGIVMAGDPKVEARDDVLCELC